MVSSVQAPVTMLSASRRRAAMMASIGRPSSVWRRASDLGSRTRRMTVPVVEIGNPWASRRSSPRWSFQGPNRALTA